MRSGRARRVSRAARVLSGAWRGLGEGRGRNPEAQRDSASLSSLLIPHSLFPGAEMLRNAFSPGGMGASRVPVGIAQGLLIAGMVLPGRAGVWDEGISALRGGREAAVRDAPGITAGERNSPLCPERRFGSRVKAEVRPAPGFLPLALEQSGVARQRQGFGQMGRSQRSSFPFSWTLLLPLHSEVRRAVYSRVSRRGGGFPPLRLRLTRLSAEDCPRG